MTIQEYSELVTMIANVEKKRAAYCESRKLMDALNVEQCEAYKENNKERISEVTERWLSAHEKHRKVDMDIARAYREFRKKIDTEEYRYLSHMFAYSSNKSDKNFYLIVRSEVMKEAKHVEFEE